MQLDLLYKGLPSAKADTRKFRVQIHSNAISFIQHGHMAVMGLAWEGQGLCTSSRHLPVPSHFPPPEGSYHTDQCWGGGKNKVTLTAGLRFSPPKECKFPGWNGRQGSSWVGNRIYCLGETRKVGSVSPPATMQGERSPFATERA